MLSPSALTFMTLHARESAVLVELALCDDGFLPAAGRKPDVRGLLLATCDRVLRAFGQQEMLALTDPHGVEVARRALGARVREFGALTPAQRRCLLRKIWMPHGRSGGEWLLAERMVKLGLFEGSRADGGFSRTKLGDRTCAGIGHLPPKGHGPVCTCGDCLRFLSTIHVTAPTRRSL